jgi:hypothetical protein
MAACGSRPCRPFPREAANQSDESYGMSAPCKGKPAMNSNESAMNSNETVPFPSACFCRKACFQRLLLNRLFVWSLVRKAWFPLVSLVDRQISHHRSAKFAIETDISTAGMVRHNAQVNEIP